MTDQMREELRPCPFCNGEVTGKLTALADILPPRPLPGVDYACVITAKHAEELHVRFHALHHAIQGVTTEAERGACKWAQEDEYGDYFYTSCGHTYVVNDGETGGMKFCTFCGRRTEFVMWTDDSDNLQADAGGEGRHG